MKRCQFLCNSMSPFSRRKVYGGESLSIILIRCAMFYCLFRAFGVAQPFTVFMFFIPLTFLAVLLPISPGGLGVHEAALVYLFGSVGVAAEVCTSSGLMFH